MKKIIITIVTVILFFSSCGSSSGDSWSWGKNLDFYELRFDDLSENIDVLSLIDDRWRVIIDDELMHIDSYYDDNFGVQGNEISNYTLSIDSNKKVTIIVSDSSTNTTDTYILTPDSEEKGSYSYKSSVNDILEKEKYGQYEVTSNGKDTDQYKAKYETTTTSNNTTSTNGSVSSASCSPYTNAYIYYWEGGNARFDDDDLASLNNICSNACDASNTGDQTNLDEYCRILHYELDATKGDAGATDCPVCN